jgi:tetratricopeptide (TPR) repeat protein
MHHLAKPTPRKLDKSGQNSYNHPHRLEYLERGRMRCPECGTEIPDNLLLCPTCGTMVEETQPMRARRSRQVEPVLVPGAQGPGRWQRLRPILFWMMGFLCLLTLSVGGAAYSGRYQGERDREQHRLELADQHYQTGIERLNAGEYELAIAEFEYALKLNPNHPTASQGIAEAQSRDVTIPTPTSEVREIVVDDLYQTAVAHYEAEDWEHTVAVLTQLRVLDATYATETVEEMLFTSLYNAGMALLAEDRFEEGIFYLDQALALRPLDEQALNQRNLAIKYMAALGYWGVNWDRCIERFEELYTIAPTYKDVFSRLYQAHVTYADTWYEQGEMCPAEVQYAQALQLMNDPDVEQKQAEANEICLVATPTPIAPITGTLPVTLTELPPGFTTGRLAYPSYNTQTGLYDVYTLLADGHLVKMASGADQPCWIWGSGALGYRDRLSGGISLLVPGEAAPRQLAARVGPAWPTFSPDGSHMAYAAQDDAGVWQIYTAPMDGSAGPTIHAAGKEVVWGPTGLLAWTGCDAGGACGIFADNPDDDQPPTRLTASLNDIGLNWAPNGESLVYMSDVSGNWDVYLVHITGGVAVLTDDPSSDGLPAWAPNGSTIAFASNRDGTWGLYLMEPDGKGPHKILGLGTDLPDWTNQRISWAP